MTRIRAAALVALALLGVSGCPRGDSCSQLVERRRECGSPEGHPLLATLEGFYLDKCRAQGEAGLVEEGAARVCARKTSCAEFHRCQRSLDEEREALIARRQIEAALASGAGIDEALARCTPAELKGEERQRLCERLLERAVEVLTRELSRARAEGLGGQGKCLDLQNFASRISPVAKASAELLCQEVQASKRAKEAIAAAQHNLAAGVHEIPLRCTMAVEDLEGLTTPWAREALAEVLRACYVALGREILPARGEVMTICEFQVDQVFRAFNKHGISDPQLDPWLARVASKCATD